MKKDIIKTKLREGLGMLEKQSAPVQRHVPPQGNQEGADSKDKPFDTMNDDEKKKVQTLTKKIKNATQGPNKLLKLSQVMDAAGVGDADDATDRSAIGKAVSGKPDADGKVRHLTVQQADAMGKVVDNPIAFK
jgi:hypothetical protein